MRLVLAVLSLALACPALAQQQQFTPQQMAMMEMGQQAGLLRSMVADLQAQNAKLTDENAFLKKQIEELKAATPSK